MNPRRARSAGTITLSALMALIGIALLVQGLLASISPLSGRFLAGALLLAAGLGRLYVEVRVRRGRGE